MEKLYQKKGLKSISPSIFGTIANITTPQLDVYEKSDPNLDDYGINGDFVESQAFAFLAIRTYKKLPITFPNTTNCSKACVGGEIVDN